MPAALFPLLAGVLLLFLGGESLVRGASRLALRLGVTPLAVGLTVVAFGTSSPELAVSVQAAFAGRGDVAIGNVVGSNICNLALILGLSALIRPLRVHARVIALDLPLMVGATAAFWWLLADGRFGRLEGGVSVLALGLYTLYNLRGAASASAAERSQEESLGVGQPGARGGVLLADGALLLGGLLGLGLGASWFVAGAVELALQLGVSEAFVALTVVALGTSLPELFTSVVAAARGHDDIAVGNLVGSNVFNLLGILGAASLARPLYTGGVAWFDLATMSLVAAAVVPLLYTGRRLSRAEGLALLALYVLYVALRPA